MNFNILNLILKAKRGGGLQNCLHLWDRVLDHCLGVLCLLFFAASYHLLNNMLCSIRLFRTVRISLFLFGPEVISILLVTSPFSFSHLI
jgi:hypothetical protein